MKISQKGIDLIKSFEGCPVNSNGKCYAYQDAVGVWTIGYGTTNADKSITGVTIEKGLTITKTVAERWLALSLDKKYGSKVNKYDSKYHWNQNQYDALMSFAYNIGSIDQLTGNGTRSVAEISEKILAYNKAGGKVLEGLTRRRKEEKALFDTVAKETDSTKTSVDVNDKAKITAKSGLVIRKDAGSTSAKLGALAYGTKVTVTQEKNGWGKVSVTLDKKKVAGWIYMRYTKKL